MQCKGSISNDIIEGVAATTSGNYYFDDDIMEEGKCLLICGFAFL